MTSTRPRNMYTEDKLRPAVAAATTLGEVLATLGLEDNPKRRDYVSQRIKALGIDTSHFPYPGMLYTEQDLRKAVAEPVTMVEVATRLGAKPVGGTIHYLRRRIIQFGLDTSHFKQSRPKRPTSAGFRRRGLRLVVDEETLPHQRRLPGQPAGEPEAPVPELSCDDEQLLPQEARRNWLTSAGDGIRTHTSFSRHWHLKPARLPVTTHPPAGTV